MRREKCWRSLQENYKHIPSFATYEEAIAAARELARRQVTEAQAQQVYAKALKSFNEKELYDLKPLVEELKAKCAETDYLIDPARKPSLADFELALIGIGKLITVSQIGNADFKTIQEAVDGAPSNSLIEIRDTGPYNEPIVIPKEKEGLTLRGRTGVYPILTSVGKRTFSTNVIVHAQGFRLDRLVIVGDQKNGGCVASDAGDVLHIDRCIVNAAVLVGTQVGHDTIRALGGHCGG